MDDFEPAPHIPNRNISCPDRSEYRHNKKPFVYRAQRAGIRTA